MEVTKSLNGGKLIVPMFKGAQCDDLKNSKWLEERVVNIPSSVTL